VNASNVNPSSQIAEQQRGRYENRNQLSNVLPVLKRIQRDDPKTQHAGRAFLPTCRFRSDQGRLTVRLPPRAVKRLDFFLQVFCGPESSETDSATRNKKSVFFKNPLATQNRFSCNEYANEICAD
jgi:hypothetical protein